MCTYTLHETLFLIPSGCAFTFVYLQCVFSCVFLAAAQLALAIALSIARGGGLAERSCTMMGLQIRQRLQPPPLSSWLPRQTGKDTGGGRPQHWTGVRKIMSCPFTSRNSVSKNLPAPSFTLKTVNLEVRLMRLQTGRVVVLRPSKVNMGRTGVTVIQCIYIIVLSRLITRFSPCSVNVNLHGVCSTGAVSK